MVTIEEYSNRYDEQIISLILHIQNREAKINLSLDEQPDLKNIGANYQANGGNFWVALSNNSVIGTIGLMMAENECAILKKFFVDKRYRSQGIGYKLYIELLKFAYSNNVKHIILDTPSVAKKSHIFYERAGFKKVQKDEVPINYIYPDRNSILYMLDL